MCLNGSVVIDFVMSKDNYSDMFTKTVGPFIFLSHSRFVMGQMEIPRVPKKVKTAEEDILPCPCCSLGVFEKYHQHQEEC